MNNYANIPNIKERRRLFLDDTIEFYGADPAMFRAVDVPTPLATREHSIRAGNCPAGTDAFARNHGWQRRNFVPVTWLLATNDVRAKSVAHGREQ